MTDYPYTFYIVGYDNIKAASSWCYEKFGRWASLDNDTEWYYHDNVTDVNDPNWLSVRIFEFKDSKTAFEFALTWG